jgi:serine O-acetyltransferase
MARETSKIKAVEKIDPVWDRIRTEAEDIARAEPGLGGFIYSAVLGHACFEDALAHRLGSDWATQILVLTPL